MECELTEFGMLLLEAIEPILKQYDPLHRASVKSYLGLWNGGMEQGCEYANSLIDVPEGES